MKSVAVFCYHTLYCIYRYSVCNAQFFLFWSFLCPFSNNAASCQTGQRPVNIQSKIVDSDYTVFDRWVPSHDGKYYVSISARRVRGTTTIITITIATGIDGKVRGTVFGRSCGQQWSYSVHRVTSPIVPTSLYAPYTWFVRHRCHRCRTCFVQNASSPTHFCIGTLLRRTFNSLGVKVKGLWY